MPTSKPTPIRAWWRALWATTRACSVVVTLAGISFSALARGQNQIVGTGISPSFQILPVVAPGEILTLFTTPLGMPDAVATKHPLPTSLSGVSVLVRVVGAMDATGYPPSLPILRIDTFSTPEMPTSGVFCSAVTGPTPVLCSATVISVEIPANYVCALTLQELEHHETCTNTPFHNDPPMLVLNVSANGVTGPDLPVQTGGLSHLLNSCDLLFGPKSSSTCHPLVTHADGSPVSDDSPARVGETITIYDLMTSKAPLGSAPTEASGGPRLLTVGFSYPVSGPVPNAGLPGTSTTVQTIVEADWVATVPGYVGLGQINVTVPPRPNSDYRCGGYTYPGQPGNAQIAIPGFPLNTLNVCVQP